MRVDALVLAGGSLKGDPTRHRSLLAFGGRTLAEIAAAACFEAGSVRRVCFVAPAAVLERLPPEPPKPVIAIEATADLVRNVVAGAEALGRDALVAIVTGDLPFITGETIDAFVDECARVEADGFYPVLAKDVLEARYPGTKRTYGRTRDGVLTGGNIFLVKASVLLDNQGLMRRLYDARKSPLRLAGVVGVPLLVKFALGLMSIADAERRVSELVGAPVRAVRTARPEIGIDVDKPEDVAFVEAYMRNSGGAVS